MLKLQEPPHPILELYMYIYICHSYSPQDLCAREQEETGTVLRFAFVLFFYQTCPDDIMCAYLHMSLSVHAQDSPSPVSPPPPPTNTRPILEALRPT